MIACNIYIIILIMIHPSRINLFYDLPFKICRTLKLYSIASAEFSAAGTSHFSSLFLLYNVITNIKVKTHVLLKTILRLILKISTKYIQYCCILTLIDKFCCV